MCPERDLDQRSINDEKLDKTDTFGAGRKGYEREKNKQTNKSVEKHFDRWSFWRHLLSPLPRQGCLPPPNDHPKCNRIYTGTLSLKIYGISLLYTYKSS